MKYLKLFEEATGDLQTKLRLLELGLGTEPVGLISIGVNWDAVGESSPVFTYRDYYDWPTLLDHDRWVEHLDHFEGQIRDWLGAEAQGMSEYEVFRQWPRFSDQVLPMLLTWLRDENWEILHLTHEGQFYDIKSGALIGEGSVDRPKWY